MLASDVGKEELQGLDGLKHDVYTRLPLRIVCKACLIPYTIQRCFLDLTSSGPISWSWQLLSIILAGV